MKAEDIMSTDVVTVETGSSIEEVVELLSQHPFSGLPVLDKEGRLVGIVSEYDLLIQKSPLNYPRFINILGGIIHLEDLSAFNRKLKKALAMQVDEVMTSDLVTVEKKTPLDEIARLMVKEKVNRLPVVEGEKLVGIITRADIVKAMSQKE